MVVEEEVVVQKMASSREQEHTHERTTHVYGVEPWREQFACDFLELITGNNHGMGWEAGSNAEGNAAEAEDGCWTKGLNVPHRRQTTEPSVFFK